MNQAFESFRIFADQRVPDSASKTFVSAVYEVQLLRNAIAVDTPDPIVAAVAMANKAVLLTVDNDFKQMARRAGFGSSKFRKLHLVKISCRPAKAADRISSAMSLIEHEWALFISGCMLRIFIEVSDGFIRTVRQQSTILIVAGRCHSPART